MKNRISVISIILLISNTFSDEKKSIIHNENRIEVYEKSKKKFSTLKSIKEHRFKPPIKPLEEFRASNKTKDLSLENEFNFSSWNINLNVRNWTPRFNDLIINNNVLFIQEARLGNEVLEKYLMPTKSNFMMSFGKGFYDTITKTDSGVMIYSQYNLNNCINLKTKYHEPIFKVYKTSLICYIEIKNHDYPLMLINTHAINFVKVDALIDQINQTQKYINKHKGPIIFAGDFNTWSLAKLKFIKYFMKKNKLSEVKFEKDKRKRFREFPLDHIFYRGLSYKNSSVIVDENSSDHNALSATFKINP